MYVSNVNSEHSREFFHLLSHFNYGYSKLVAYKHVLSSFYAVFLTP